MNNRRLLQSFREWQATEASLVLITVVETAGSTYSKAGEQLLITADGRYAGLVSGGCLEGDLVLHAKEVLASGTPQLLSYDMRNPDDELWGLGLGCNGMLRLLLQPLDAATDWQPFAALADSMAAPVGQQAALIVASDSAAYPIGQLHLGNDMQLNCPANTSLPAILSHQLATATAEALHWQIRPWPRLLLLGAGPDAEAIVRLTEQLGWECCLADHRPDRIRVAGDWPATTTVQVTPADLEQQLNLHSFTAVVLMTHHLATDAAYLRCLTRHQHDYVGVLGPAARRERLLADLKLEGSAFAARLRGPVGLDIGAASPEGIALALLAEIHASLYGGDGSGLTATPVQDRKRA